MSLGCVEFASIDNVVKVNAVLGYDGGNAILQCHCINSSSPSQRLERQRDDCEASLCELSGSEL